MRSHKQRNSDITTLLLKFRVLSWVGALLTTACTANNEAAQPTAERVSKPGVYSGYSDKVYDERVLESRYVEMRDGTKLAVDIFLPAVDGKAVPGKFPMVFIHTPYRRAHITPEGERVSILARGDSAYLELTDYGYAVGAVDTRGRGASFGARRGFLDRTEAYDAYDMTEWFAAQPWSDGNVGIAGCSYNGAATLHAATTAPPHLKAIAPGCFAFDSYRMVSRGGIPAQFNTRPEDPERDYGHGVAPVDGDTDGSMAAAAIEMHYNGTPMAELWRGMPYRDDISPLLNTDFWRETSASSYIDTLEKSGIAIFMWGNWQDEGSFQQVLAFNNLKNERKLWMGGWGHCETGDFPMQTELRRFFDFYLKGIDNGWDKEPAVDYYTIGAKPGNEWTAADTWPPPETEQVELFFEQDPDDKLHNALTLAPLDSPGPVTRFRVDYSPECANSAIDMYFLFRPCVLRSPGAVFLTPPLAEHAHILGHPLLELQLSATTADADLFAYLESVGPNGEVTIISHGRLRASHRKESDPDLNYFGIPYHRGNRADTEPLKTGEQVSLRFDLLPTSIIVQAGSRLRVSFAGADPRQRFRTVVFDPAPVISLHSGGKAGSKVILPVTENLKFSSAK